MIIHENMTIQELITVQPKALALLKQNGLEKFEAPEVRNSLGSILKLRSALKLAHIDPEKFLHAIRQLETQQAESDSFTEDYSQQQRLTLLGLLPCGMKMPFKRKIDEYIATLDTDMEIHSLIEGNVNHELSYYPYIETLSSIEELPDVIISSDINSFFHHAFIEKFVDNGCFEAFELETHNPDFTETDYPDPRRAFTMLSANILLIVENTTKSVGYALPTCWDDLLKPEYENSVTMRGQNDFFCSGVLLPFYQKHGESAIYAMARTVKKGLHPAEMIKEIERQAETATPFYIMPKFFADRLKDQRQFKIIYPSDGAIISPVFMLIKKDRKDVAKLLADFVVGREMSQFCADAGFPALRADVDNHLPEDCTLSWMGWDFLNHEDPKVVKKRISTIFAETFGNGKTG